MTNAPIDYGKALLQARTARGMTQRELADRAGMASSYVSHIECGVKRPSADMLDTLAKSMCLPLWLIAALGSSEEDLGPDVARILPSLTAPPT